jgi:uncharacterized repeat protein (TIGR03899 family)
MSETANGSTDISVVKDNEQALVKAPQQEVNKNKTAPAISAQRQLLGLAAKFNVEGGLVADNKKIPLQDRTQIRVQKDLLRKQQNIEAIIKCSVQYCSNQQVVDRADHDWFCRFIDLCNNISNKTMQDLWAKILAGEMASPGSFSYKSLKAFQTMSMIEAKLFAKACSLSIKDHSRQSMRIISGGYQPPNLLNFFKKNRNIKLNLSHFGLTYAELLTLADNQLIFIQETETTTFATGEGLQLNFHGTNLQLTAKKNQAVLCFYKFTPIGAELAQLISDNPDQSYFSAIKAKLAPLFSISDNA